MGAGRPKTPYRHKVPLLSSRFRYAQKALSFGHARLFGDRIELVSWGVLGRRKRILPLDSIGHMDYHPLEKGSNLSLQLDTGEELHLRVDQAHLWREYFENWLSYNVLASAKYMSEQEKAATISG